MDWTQFMQGQDQQGQIDQQLADLLQRRKAYQPAQHTTGLGALLGAIGDYRNRQAFQDQEGALRGQRAQLSGQMASGRQSYLQELMQAQQGAGQTPAPEGPGGMPSFGSQPDPQRQQHLQMAGMLSGDPTIQGYLQHAPQMEMQGLQAQKTREDMTAQNSPEAGAATRQLLAKLGFKPPETTPSATLRALLPTAEKSYDAEQNRQSKKEIAQIMAGAKVTASGMGGAGGDQVKAIADAIESGQQPPDLKGMYRFAAPVRAELAKRGYDLSSAQQEWTATTKHLASLNGTQQERLRQGIDFANHSLELIDKLYEDWKGVGVQTGIKMFNRASLAVAKQLPGDAGAAAQALEGQINDLTAELANVYMGGNSPTDHAIKLAAQNLQGNWNEETFKKAIKLIGQNLTLRRNAMLQSPTAGGSRYDKPAASAAAPASGAPSPSAPRAKRTVNGETREWDGQTWVPIGR